MANDMIVKKLAAGYEQIYIVILKKLNMVCIVWVVIWSFDFYLFIYFCLYVDLLYPPCVFF